MDARFIQAHKKVRWAPQLTPLYLVTRLVTAYLPDPTLGLTGLPH